MPLFVPVLRLAMLFLNIYDSYKTLKIPPPSMRNNDGKPSLRALTQRKRDLKGCLAVWIVWCCFTTYERLIEGIISLFVPFYDEFKSIALLFLILTRARGAEPIYLHVIRPFLKPYTSSVDSVLDLFRLIGDFLYALVMVPINIALERLGSIPVLSYFKLGSFDSDPDSLYAQSFNSPPVLEEPLSAAASYAALGHGRPRPNGVQFPKKVNSDRRHTSNTHSNGKAEACNNQQHQIWYPPASSYADEQGQRASPPEQERNALEDEQAEVIIVEEVEEWRKYPPFPSAYPPTPVVTTTRLVPAALRPGRQSTRTSSVSLDPHIYPPIPEDLPQQDFRRSLLPPREPLNPGHVGDLSDDITITILGVPTSHGTSSGHLRVHDTDPMVVSEHENDSLSDDEYEEEDEFNITLRTPLPPLGSFRSHATPLRGHISSIASSSAASRLTGLTTADDNPSPLRTGSDSESSVSAPSSIPDSSMELEPKPTPTLPELKTPSTVKRKVQQLEDTITKAKDTASSRSSILKPSITRRKAPLKRRRLSHQSSTSQSDAETSTSVTADDVSEDTSSEAGDIHDGPAAVANKTHQKAPETKRRRVMKTSPKRALHPSRPVRPRVTRPASPPTRTTAQQAKPSEISEAPLRTSTRLRSAAPPATRSARSRAAFSANTSQSSLSSAAAASDTNSKSEVAVTAAVPPNMRPKAARKTATKGKQ